VTEAVAKSGFRLLDLEAFPYRYEDVVLVYARRRNAITSPSRTSSERLLNASVAGAKAYAAAFQPMSKSYQALFHQLASQGGKVAAYGAGHLTCAFLNFHDVARYFAFVVDDTPEKQGLFLPKTGLPIVSSDRLVADRITTCLFGFNPQVEKRVIAKCDAFVAQGGRFLSMLVDSDISVRQLL